MKIKVRDPKEKEEFHKLIATSRAGNEPTLIVDQLGLALLLMTVYGQELCGVDWTHDRGEMFVFVDNPTVRSCVAVWRESIKDDDIMSVTERYLFNLLSYGSHDAFIELEQIEMEQRAWRKEVRTRYGEIEVDTSNQVTNKGDN